MGEGEMRVRARGLLCHQSSLVVGGDAMVLFPRSTLARWTEEGWEGGMC